MPPQLPNQICPWRLNINPTYPYSLLPTPTMYIHRILPLARHGREEYARRYRARNRTDFSCQLADRIKCCGHIPSIHTPTEYILHSRVLCTCVYHVRGGPPPPPTVRKVPSEYLWQKQSIVVFTSPPPLSFRHNNVGSDVVVPTLTLPTRSRRFTPPHYRTFIESTTRCKEVSMDTSSVPHLLDET